MAKKANIGAKKAKKANIGANWAKKANIRANEKLGVNKSLKLSM